MFFDDEEDNPIDRFASHAALIGICQFGISPTPCGLIIHLQGLVLEVCMENDSAIQINEGFRTLSRRLRLGICGALAVGGLALSGPSIADQPSVDGILAESLIWLSPPVPASQTPFQTGGGKEVNLETFREAAR